MISTLTIESGTNEHQGLSVVFRCDVEVWLTNCKRCLGMNRTSFVLLTPHESKTVRRSIIVAIFSAFIGTSFPAIGTAAYSRPAPRRATAARPIKSSPSHWKAQVGTLRPYARAARLRAARAVGNRVVKYPPPKYTIEGLLARRALNPTRFDLAHPNLGRLLDRDARLRAAGNSGSYNGLLISSARHNYLRWRWGLNPARFEHFHPILGVILAEDHRLQNLTPPPPVIPPPVTPGEPGGSPGGENGGGGSGGEGPGEPQVVPEPASVVLIALGASLLGFHRVRRSLRNRSRRSAQTSTGFVAP
jgi:hypothetical protein